MNRRAFYVTVYATNKTHGPFLKREDAEAYAKRRPGAVSTLSCYEIVNGRDRVHTP